MATRQHAARLLLTLLVASAMLIGCSESRMYPSSSKPLIKSAGREQARERMAEGFSNPPPEARPRDKRIDINTTSFDVRGRCGHVAHIGNPAWVRPAPDL